MNNVKSGFVGEPIHSQMLMGLLFREVRAIFAAEDWGGLRPSHFRVISSVPNQGIAITELSERVGMTKQGCGQFVTKLVNTGHLTVEPDAADRRVRIVRPTRLGQEVMDAVLARILSIEHVWAERVGEERYRTFRSVLEELALEPYSTQFINGTP